MARERVVLAYSGGLDTSAAVRWLMEKYEVEVVTLTVDLGQEEDLEAARAKALKTGAVDARVVDARALFVDYFIWPSLMAGSLYQGRYPLATALGRPLIAKLMIDTARETGASAVAHGCTGKGNDQVRFDVTFQTLAPELRIIAPIREWKMTRPETVEYARSRGIEVPAAHGPGFSIDENLWGRSIEAGPLEDPWLEPPETAFAWTCPPGEAPAEPETLEIEFERGIPVALDGRRLAGVELIRALHRAGGRHGVGRLDLVEDRVVGIKSREIYEAPAALILHAAHADLESLTLSKEARRFKTAVSEACADITYNGLWYSAFHQDLMAFVASSQRYVTGTVRVRLLRGTAQVVGRRSDYSLYSPSLATYAEGDAFDHDAAVGFIALHGLASRRQADAQLRLSSEPLQEIRLIPPPAKGDSDSS